ncbi:MAG TPA: c-type cytochrome [Chitinophagaceae bacterium]|nr:c-type cytochrome [Chitinophagaceae bacterium]
MKKMVLRFAGSLAGVAVVGFCAIIIWLKVILPDVGKAPDIHIRANPAEVARGSYLVQHVARCMDCHSDRDMQLTAGPMEPGTMGQGGEVFDESKGLPGHFVAKNITPYNLGFWTDGEIFRAITAGVTREGKSLFPVMPFPNYGQLDSLDICAIISYIRTIPSIHKDVEDSRPDFPVNWKINTYPSPPHFRPAPPAGVNAAYGKYLVLMANCQGCHGDNFSGNEYFPLPTGGVVHSSNITPDQQYGIGSWSLEAFISRFKFYSDSSFHPLPIAREQFNSAMPWTFFSGMTVRDLSAIYTYLRTIPPVHQAVVRFVP